MNIKGLKGSDGPANCVNSRLTLFTLAFLCVNLR